MNGDGGAFHRRLRLRDDRGAQAVEFAIIVPIVLLLIGAVVQFGFIFTYQVTVTQAARDGVRYAVVHPLPAGCDPTVTPGCDGGVIQQIKTYTEQHAPGMSISDSQVTVTGCSNQGTGDAKVTISYGYGLGAPLINKQISINGKATMPCGG